MQTSRDQTGTRCTQGGYRLSVPNGIANTMFGYSASEKKKKKSPPSPRVLQMVHLLKVAFLCLDASSASEINSQTPVRFQLSFKET